MKNVELQHIYGGGFPCTGTITCYFPNSDYQGGCAAPDRREQRHAFAGVGTFQPITF